MLKQHKVVAVTTDHYLPGFKKVSMPVIEETSQALSSQYECISCQQLYSTKDTVIFHIKNSHVSEIKSDSQKGKKVVFKPPLRSDIVNTDKEQSLSTPISKSVSNASLPSPMEGTLASSKKLAKPKHNEGKKINYFKELENVLVDKKKTKKLNLWGAATSTVRDECDSTVHESDTSGSTVRPQNIQNSNERNVGEISPSWIGDMLIPSVESDNLPHTESVLIRKKRGRKPKVSHINSGIKKGRFFCGLIECVPCSVTVDCGVCDECLNKKFKK